MEMPSSKRPTLFARLNSLSLRAKLIIGNMVILILAIIGTGYYVYSRSQTSNAFLSKQLDTNELQQAEERLNNISNEQAAALNDFFVSLSKDTSLIGRAAENLLAQQDAMNRGVYWNASESLTRLPNGSWDNQNWEPASIFIPAKADLTGSLAIRLNTLRYLDFTAPAVLKKDPEIVAIYFGGRDGETLYYPNIDLAALVPPDFDVTSRPWYVAASPAQDPSRNAAWSIPYLDATTNGLIITSSVPVYDSGGIFRGVLAMDIQLNRISELVSNIKVGDTGFAMLVDRNVRLIALPSLGYYEFGTTSGVVPLGKILDTTKFPNAFQDTYNVLYKAAAGQTGLTTINLGGVERLVVYRPIPEVGYGLVIIVPSNELMAGAIAARQQIAQTTANTVTNSILLVGVILILAVIATLWLGTGLTLPLRALTKTAEDITRGNLEAEAKVQGGDEIGTLAQAFNAMTTQMRGMIGGLETRVADRTRDLERRTLQIQTAAEIGNAAVSLRNLDELLTQATRLISERYGFYHVGIFLLNASRDYAVLRASNSPGGKRMLERGHRLKVGEVGIVGYVTGAGEARVVLDVGKEAVYFENPDLPETRSEMALPLKAGGKIIGALDIQSKAEAAFSNEDIATLQILANQLAVAIENAGLFAENQAALEKARLAYGDISRAGWQNLLGRQTDELGYISLAGKGTQPVAGQTSPEFLAALKSGQPVLSNEAATLHLPITVRGNAIGAIRLDKRKGGKWPEGDIATASALAEQLSAALESARLFNDISQRAERERLVADITARIGANIKVDDILSSTVDELGRLLGDSEISIQIQPSDLK
jgi:GAF domain-containing protein/HAMP domain-containing protein